jgi:hypothetical protein
LWNSRARRARNVTDPKSWLEAAALIKVMYPAIFAARLQEDMIAIISPSCCERGRNDRPSMASTTKLGMRDNVFEKSVSPATTQEIGCGDERAGRNDPTVHS